MLGLFTDIGTKIRQYAKLNNLRLVEQMETLLKVHYPTKMSYYFFNNALIFGQKLHDSSVVHIFVYFEKLEEEKEKPDTKIVFLFDECNLFVVTLMLPEEDTHPLLADYLRNQDPKRHTRGNHGEQGFSGTNDATSTTDASSAIAWTSCDEFRRCSCAILSFVLMALFVGTALVVFWFLWAWFVLWLDLPGILTPIVWLCGFAAPLCVFRLFTLCPHCTRGCCSKTLQPPSYYNLF
ncbi:hypothetical protein RFI_30929, partial [Reticulomyxa filosa]